MNKSRSSIYAIVLACSALVLSCVKELPLEERNNVSSDSENVIVNEVHIIAGNDVTTKSRIAENGEGYVSKWESTDVIGLFQVYEKDEQTKCLEEVTSTHTALSNENSKADFTVPLSDVTGGSNYKYVAVYPSGIATYSNGYINLSIPESQTFGTTTFDKNADIMVSERVDRASYSSDALEMGFARVGSIVGMTLKGLTVGETVEKVIISTTEEGKYLAGTIKYDVTNKDLIEGITSGSQTLTLNAPSNTLVPDGGSLSVWFRCAAVELTEDLTVTVYTKNGVNSYVYAKTIDLATAGKTLNFKSGHLAKFGITGLKRGPGEGLYIIHYSAVSMIMSADDDSQSYRKALDNNLELTSGKYNASSLPHAVWRLEYNRITKCHKFYSVSGSKYMTQSCGLGSAYGFILDDNGNGTFNIMTADATPQHVGYNSSTNPKRFKTYSSNSSIGISPMTFTPAYSTPVATYDNIDLDSPNAISIPVAIAAKSFLFANSVSLVGVYSNSEMTTPTDWLSVSVTDAATGALSYTAAANDGAARTAYVKLTANGDNNLSSVVSFSVTQIGAGSSVTTLFHETFGNNTTTDNVSWGDGVSSYLTWKTGTYGTYNITQTNWKIGKSSVDPCNLDGSSGLSAVFAGSKDQTFILKFGDLSSYSAVNISFNWHNNAGNNKARTFSFQISGNGGSNWSDNIIDVNSLTTQAWRNCNYEIPNSYLNNLWIKFTNTATNVSRVDDIIVNATSSTN